MTFAKRFVSLVWVACLATARLVHPATDETREPQRRRTLAATGVVGSCQDHLLASGTSAGSADKANFTMSFLKALPPALVLEMDAGKARVRLGHRPEPHIQVECVASNMAVHLEKARGPRCVTLGDTKWFELPADQPVPERFVVPIRQGARWARARLAGRCLVLLGDSLMADTATDVGFLLGADYKAFGNAATRANAEDKASQAYRDASIAARLLPSHRNMTIRPLDGSDGVVFNRFIGAPAIHGNGLGMLSLMQWHVRNEVERAVAGVCGARERFLVVKSGGHDLLHVQSTCKFDPSGGGGGGGGPASAVHAPDCTRKFVVEDPGAPGEPPCKELLLRGQWTCVTHAYVKAMVGTVLPWLEGLASHRIWLPTGDIVDAFWEDHLVRGRPGWRVADEAEAWGCEAMAGTAMMGGWGAMTGLKNFERENQYHFGAIQRFYHRTDPPFCCAHRSLLRTMLALQMLPPPRE